MQAGSTAWHFSAWSTSQGAPSFSGLGLIVNNEPAS
jgi:hypothetical protein